jgi:hypothetical protein
MWPFIRSPRSKRPRIRPFLECSCWCNFRSSFFLRVFRCSRFLSRIRFHVSSWAIWECLVDFGESNSFECLWISRAPVLEAQKRTIDQWIPGCTGFSQEQGVRVAVWEDRILTRRWWTPRSKSTSRRWRCWRCSSMVFYFFPVIFPLSLLSFLFLIEA